MFSQLFSTMNDLLDQIVQLYSSADAEEKKELQHQLAVLQTMSADCMENWLLFEEKMAKFKEASAHAPVSGIYGESEDTAISPTEENWLLSEGAEAFERGQGYFKLLMFDEAIREFKAVVIEHPNFIWARVYLALGFLHKGDHSEAYRQFRFIIPMTNQTKILAVVYNAMGCIQASKSNLEEALKLFRKAHKLDPELQAPLANMEVCRESKGPLHDGAGTLH